MNNEEIENQISKIKQKNELTKKDHKRIAKLEKRLGHDKVVRNKKIVSLFKRSLGGFIIVIVVIGVIWMLSKQSRIPEDEIVSRNGLHWHPKLTIIIDGKPQEMPANIGIDATVHQELHTHDKDVEDGTIHMEMEGLVTKDETKLGNFFKIWKKEFNATQIFDKKNGQGGSVKMMVNGKENKEFENYLMKDNDTIEIRYEK